MDRILTNYTLQFNNCSAIHKKSKGQESFILTHVFAGEKNMKETDSVQLASGNRRTMSKPCHAMSNQRTW